MLNIESILYHLLGALSGSIGAINWPIIKQVSVEYFDNSKLRLFELANARVKNEIDNDFFLQRTKDELKILESELLSMAVMGKSQVQDAINTTIVTFADLIGKITSTPHTEI